MRWFVAILALVSLSALHSHEVRSQEGGGFQVPLNSDPVIPTPTGQAGQPGFYTGPDFLLSSGSGHANRLHIVACVAKALAVIFRSDSECPRPQVTDSLRKPKPGEHLGDYLVAEKLPLRLPPVGEVRLPETTVPLPPHVETPPIRYFRMGSWREGWDRPWVPKLGDLPPKPGEHFGDYALTSELPPRYAAPEIKLPTTTAPLPPSFLEQLEIGYRFSSGPSSAASATPASTTDHVTFKFSGPCEVNYARPFTQKNGFYQAAPTIKSCNLVPKEDYRVRLTYTPPGKPTQVFTASMTVALPNSKTEAFVKHSAVPVAFTDEDFAQVNDGKVVVKVIYLPDPDPQDPSLVVGAEEVNSTQLEASLDPIKEASSRGTVLATIKLRRAK